MESGKRNEVNSRKFRPRWGNKGPVRGPNEPKSKKGLVGTGEKGQVRMVAPGGEKNSVFRKVKQQKKKKPKRQQRRLGWKKKKRKEGKEKGHAHGPRETGTLRA